MIDCAAYGAAEIGNNGCKIAASRVTSIPADTSDDTGPLKSEASARSAMDLIALRFLERVDDWEERQSRRERGKNTGENAAGDKERQKA